MTDESGLDLLARRLEMIPGCFHQLFNQTWTPRPVTTPVVATGLGSSEAHARYLVSLFQRYGTVPARFTPVADFVTNPVPRGETLIVFSQGLSRNTQLVFQKRHAFHRLILFTSATVDGLMDAGKCDRGDLLFNLISEGAETVWFPIEDEYTILIRVIGPACGFLASRLWFQSVPSHPLPSLSPADWERTVSSIQSPTEWFLEQANALADGFIILASGILRESSYNLISKFVEGLFWPAPTLLDYLSFAHGPFQQLAHRMRPVVMLVGDSEAERDLARRARTMCQSIHVPTLEIAIPACPSLAPLLVELLFNPIILSLAKKLGVQQVNWPGKGLDAPIYAYP